MEGMHIPDGILSVPVWATLNAAAVPGVGWAVRRAKQGLAEGQVPLLGVMGAFVFAAHFASWFVLWWGVAVPLLLLVVRFGLEYSATSAGVTRVTYLENGRIDGLSEGWNALHASVSTAGMHTTLLAIGLIPWAIVAYRRAFDAGWLRALLTGTTMASFVVEAFSFDRMLSLATGNGFSVGSETRTGRAIHETQIHHPCYRCCSAAGRRRLVFQSGSGNTRSSGQYANRC